VEAMVEEEHNTYLSDAWIPAQTSALAGAWGFTNKNDGGFHKHHTNPNNSI